MGDKCNGCIRISEVESNKTQTLQRGALMTQFPLNIWLLAAFHEQTSIAKQTITETIN